ncbi:MAG: hypothetical protein QXU32_10940 [Nitrososphaerales archaeon]
MNNYSFAQEEFTYRLEVEGNTYNIPYRITNGKLVNIQADLPSLEIIIIIAPSGNGKLDIQLPRVLVDKLANIGMLSVFLEGNSIDYTENSTCDYRTISVNFDDSSEEILLVGTYTRSPDEPKLDATLELEAEGKDFGLTTRSDSTICDWRLIKDEKKLQIDVQDGNWFEISVPSELIGGPYTVLVNGKKVDFDISGTEAYSTISVNYNNARTIDIIGTTVIPEFAISIVMVSLAMTAMLLLRFKRLLHI